MSIPLSIEAQTEATALLDSIGDALVVLSRGADRHTTKTAIRETATRIVALGFGIVELAPLVALNAGFGLGLAPRQTLSHDGPSWLLTPEPELPEPAADHAPRRMPVPVAERAHQLGLPLHAPEVPVSLDEGPLTPDELSALSLRGWVPLTSGPTKTGALALTFCNRHDPDEPIETRTASGWRMELTQ